MRLMLEPVAVIRFCRKTVIELIAYKKYIAIFIGFPFKMQLFRKSKDSYIGGEKSGEGREKSESTRTEM